jgi:peptidoglycan/LPS O-acetylase OafA/YrhL
MIQPDPWAIARTTSGAPPPITVAVAERHPSAVGESSPITLTEPSRIAVPEHPPGDWRVNNFDLIRLLAALQVAVVHAFVHLKPGGPFFLMVRSVLELFPGVPVFFVISGLLISRSYEQSDSLRNYYRNRCLRIFPGLWVCLVASLGVILICGVGSLGSAGTGDWLLWWAAQMSVFQGYAPQFLTPLGTGMLNGSLWTIPVELEFYLLLPALYFVFGLRRRRQGDWLVLGVLLASLGVQLVLVYGLRRFARVAEYGFLFATLVPYLWMFLVGVLIQRNWVRVRGWFAHRGHWWVVGYVSICVVARWVGIGNGGNNMNPLFFVPLAGVVVGCAMSAPALADRVLGRRDVSYGTYIYHMLVINLMVEFGVGGGMWAVVGAVGVAVGIAVVSWGLVERPFLRGKRGALRGACETTAGGAAISN